MKEKKEVKKKAENKIVSVSESEALQKEGWIVTAMYLKDGVKVHELKKEA